MSYTTVNYRDVDPVSEGLYFLRDPLGCEQLGLTVLECDPGWSGKEHTHVDRDHEEVYLLLEGRATVTIEGDAVEMESGDAVRILPETSRQIENGDTESRFVLAGAP